MTKAPVNPWIFPKLIELSARDAALYSLPKEILAGRGIAPRRPDQVYRAGEWIENLPLTAAFVGAVLREMRVPAASPGQLQALKDIEQSYVALEERLTAWSSSAVNERHQKLKELAYSTPEDVRLLGVDALRDEARARRRGLNGECGKLSAEAYAIALTICQDARAAMKKFSAGREKLEREESEKYGLEFQPSAILVTAWQASWRLVADLPDPVLQAAPRHILRYIPISLTPEN